MTQPIAESPIMAPRVRGASEILDAAMQIFRRHAAQFLTIAAIGYVPFFVVQLLVTRTFVTPFGPASIMATQSPVFGLFGIVAIVWFAFLEGALINAASDAYLGRPIDIAAVFRRAVPSIVGLAVAMLLKGIMLGLGFIFFILPFFYFLGRYFAVQAAVVIEHIGPVEGMHRSAVLSKGIKGHIVATLLLVFVIYVLLYAVAGVIGAGLFAATRTPVVAQVLGALAAILVYSIAPIVQTVLYYDARIRKEGFGAAGEPVARGPMAGTVGLLAQ